jgi:hypothetical protein
MGITKVRSFTGEAEILGAVRNVTFDGGNNVLVIHDVDTLETALALLDNLALGTLQAVKPSRLGADNPSKNGNGAHAMQTATSLPQPPMHLEPKPALPVTKSEPEKAEAVEEVAEKKAAAPPGPDGMPSALLAAKRLPDVVGYFFEQGIKDVDAITAECEKVRHLVPALKRVGDMRDRVSRTVEAYFKENA